MTQASEASREALRRRLYDVTYNTWPNGLASEGAEPVEVHQVIEVRAGDQLRGELEAGKNMLPSLADAPMNNVSVWVWCALVRLGHYAEKYPTFRNRDLIDFGGVNDDTGDQAGVDVDPTEGRPASGSPSPASTETPGSGSTPTSTTG